MTIATDSRGNQYAEVENVRITYVRPPTATPTPNGLEPTSSASKPTRGQTAARRSIWAPS